MGMRGRAKSSAYGGVTVRVFSWLLEVADHVPDVGFFGLYLVFIFFFFFSSRRRHTRWPRDWSSDVCSSDLALLAQAIEAEVAEFLAKHVDLKTATGLGRVVRHGHLPEREVMTGIGPVGVRQPRVRDRGAADDAGRIRFTPAILPPYARRSRSLEVLIPILYLKGISTGDFEEALAALLGKDAPGLSASTIARLKEVWIDEHEHWRKRDLSAKHYAYVWADGTYLHARLEDAKQCILLIIRANPA